MSFQSTPEQRSALLVAVVSSFMIPFMGSAVVIALPEIARTFNLNAIVTNWVATIYLLAAAMFLVPFGRAADIYGRKHIFSAGIVVYTIASLFVALAQSAKWLIAFRAMQGVGGAMLFGTGIAILTSAYPASERGRVLGINVAAVYLGLAMGPFLGGILTSTFSWRSIFFLNVPIGIFIVALVWWKLKGEWAESHGERFDFPGAILYGFALALVMYGLSLLPKTIGFIVAGAGIIAGLVFLAWELMAKNPVLHVSLFWENRAFLLSNLAAFTNYAATTAGGFLLSLYLQIVKGMSPGKAGLVLLCQPALMTIFSPFAGRMSDRVEPRVVATTGMALTALGLLFFMSIGSDSSLLSIYCGLVLLGAGMGLFSSPNTNAIMSSVEKKHFGVASGMVGTMRLTGQMLSMGITMLLFALIIGQRELDKSTVPEFLQSARIAFGIFFVLCVLGTAASMARGKIRD